MTAAQVVAIIAAFEPEERALFEALYAALKAPSEQGEVAAARTAVHVAADVEAALMDKT